MNILVYNACPYKAAQHYDLRRANKIALECLQMTATALQQHGNELHNGLYKPFKRGSGYAQHPVTQWVCADVKHLAWTLQHADALLTMCEQHFKPAVAYKTRTQWDLQRKVFWQVLGVMVTGVPHPTTFQNSARNATHMLDFTHIDDTHQAYKEYSVARWGIDLYDADKPYCAQFQHQVPPPWVYDVDKELYLLLFAGQRCA